MDSGRINVPLIVIVHSKLFGNFEVEATNRNIVFLGYFNEFGAVILVRGGIVDNARFFFGAGFFSHGPTLFLGFESIPVDSLVVQRLIVSLPESGLP